MGAKIAPDKSYICASTPAIEKWLRETWWNEIADRLEIVKDFRHLGGTPPPEPRGGFPP